MPLCLPVRLVGVWGAWEARGVTQSSHAWPRARWGVAGVVWVWCPGCICARCSGPQRWAGEPNMEASGGLWVSRLRAPVAKGTRRASTATWALMTALRVCRGTP